MRIQKVQAAQKTEQTVAPVKSASDKYTKAAKYIRSAIDCLSEDSKDDVFAKETIANLGVVAFDIASHKSE